MNPAHKKVFIRTILVAAGVALLPLLYFCIWRIRLAHDVARQLAAIHASALPINPDELDAYYRAVPDAENAALVVTQAFALMASYPDSRSNLVYKFEFPLPSRQLSAEQRDLLIGHVASNQLAIQKVSEVAAFPHSRYPIDLKPGFGTLLTHLAKIQKLAQTVSFAGVLAVEDNKPKEAIQSVGTILRISQTLKCEPILISQLIRYRMDKMAKLVFERCFNADTLDKVNLTALDSELRGWEETNRLFQSMIGERASATPLFQMNFAQFYAFTQNPGTDLRNIHDSIGTFPLTLLFQTSGFFQQDLRFYLTVMNTNINLSKLPAPENLAITNIWSEVLEEAKDRKHVMSAMLLPALESVYFKDAESVAVIRLSQTAVAVEHFRLEAGSLPENLEELVPRFLPAAPLDPFNGQPIHYHHLKKGYVIYSVGRDGQDNGGRERPPDAKSSDKTPYDITFTVER